LIEVGHFNLDQESIGHRLNAFVQKLHELDAQYKPSHIAFEDIQMQASVGNNVVTFKVLAYIQAMLIIYCEQQHISYSIISSNSWKSFCGIKGKKRDEQKRNAQEWVTTKFNRKVTQDEADSVCLGFYSVNSQ